VKGKESYGRPVWPPRLGKQKPGKLPPPFIVGVDTCKEVLYARLQIPTPGPGYVHVPVGRPLYWFQMVTAERRVADYSKPTPIYKWVLVTQGRRNEAGDARNYAYAALKGLEQMTAFRLSTEEKRVREMAEAKASGTARPKTIFMPKPMVSDDPYLS
jgi:phage terminase large subunit GpA-like protein